MRICNTDITKSAHEIFSNSFSIELYLPLLSQKGYFRHYPVHYVRKRTVAGRVGKTSLRIRAKIQAFAGQGGRTDLRVTHTGTASSSSYLFVCGFVVTP